jgi:hypothetical protein
MKNRFRVFLVTLAVGWSLAPSCNVTEPTASVSGLGTIYDVAVEGDLAVTAASDVGLTFVDLSDPRAPVVAGSLDLPDIEYALDLADGLAYALEARGLGVYLSIVDVSQPADPQLVSRTLLPGALGIGDVVARDDYVYLGTTAEGLQILDVSDPSDPTIVATLPTSTWAAGISLSGDRAAVVTGSGDVLFADVTSPLDPVAFWEYRLDSEGVMLVGDVFVSMLASNTQLLDVSVPTSPYLVSWAPVVANDALLSGSDLYFATDGGVSLFDVSDPTWPQLTAEVVTPGPVVAIAKRDTVVLAASSGGTLTVILSF